MDRSGNASPLSVPTPQSPPAPLALSEFMAQTAPFSDTTNPSDTPPFPPGGSKPEVVEEPSRVSEQDKPPQSQTPEQQQSPALQAPPRTPDSSPPPADWLATRQQLLPRRNQGKKADWIRGWSQAVSMHGEETYCACSETVESNRGRKGKASDLAGNVRAILQRAGSPSNNNKPAAPCEPEVCRNCSRPASPPPSTGTSLAGEKYGLAGGRSFSKRVSELLMRVRSPRPSSWRSKSEHKRGDSAGGGKIAWLPEECQPRWATTGQGQKRFLVRPPSQPVPAPAMAPAHKARSMDIFPGHARRRSNPYNTPSSETSDSDAPRPGLSRSTSRLQRAAALLQRATSRPKD
ncbi:hypothetical protein C8A03DRAFT_42415 [Achaetomium macrosporum]|uniref:Uncharacterized protein n=1 Tax=Achaetomium macrosporum TaxID=79813 RepID=A0AAN7CE11_9PEZI|nr:hypothetical protein C8A03DRAFT_42415 [Achaetomium macrosporum]